MAQRTAATDVTVYRNGFPTGTVYKYGNGPLANNIGDEEVHNAPNGQFWSATLPGPGASSRYRIGVTRTGATTTSEFVDTMPCADGTSGPVFTSAPVGTVCQNPVFNPTDVWTSASAPSGWAPQATLTDGSVVPLQGQDRSFQIPAAAVGRVSTLTFPRSAGLTGPLEYQITGWADTDRVQGDDLRNTTQATLYADATTPTGQQTCDVGHLYIVQRTVLGMQKSVHAVNGNLANPADLQWSLTGSVTSTTALQHDLVVVDTLPAGLTPTFTSESHNSTLLTRFYTGKGDVTPRIEVLGQDDGTTRVRYTIPKEQLNALYPQGGVYQVSGLLRTNKVPTGTWVNTAQIFTESSGVDTSQCSGGSEVSTDPTDLDHNPATSFSCRAESSFTVAPAAVPDAMSVQKWVKGNDDTAFQSYPSVGHIPAGGGSAAFRLDWTNQSSLPLDHVVLYDLLPRPGDTGTTQTASSLPRGSQFRATLASVPDLPAGVTAAYSKSDNPCRPEIKADNPVRGRLDHHRPW